MQWKHGLLAAAAGALTVSTALLSTGSLAATPYSDVPPPHWAYNAVQWAAQHGIMTGPGNKPGMFDASSFANRAEVVTVLARYNTLIAKQIADLQNRIDLLEDRIDKLEGRKTSSSSSSKSSVLSSGLFRADLTAAQETQTVVSNGTGHGDFALNGLVLTYDITISGLTSTLTAGHFHAAPAGQAGPVVEPITFNGTRAQGTWTLTGAERNDLLAGRLYVNVHTTQYPDGEIRGQIHLNTGSSSSQSSSRFSSSSVFSSLSSSSSSYSLSSMSSSSVSG